MLKNKNVVKSDFSYFCSILKLITRESSIFCGVITFSSHGILPNHECHVFSLPGLCILQKCDSSCTAIDDNLSSPNFSCKLYWHVSSTLNISCQSVLVSFAISMASSQSHLIIDKTGPKISSLQCHVICNICKYSWFNIVAFLITFRLFNAASYQSCTSLIQFLSFLRFFHIEA